MSLIGPPRVFVYGTLMPGERNYPVAARGGAFVGTPATLRGFALYHLAPEGYPALWPDVDAAPVHGHVLTYPEAHWPQALAHLDELEDVHASPPLYRRERVTVELGGELPPLSAWVYVFARPERLAGQGARRLPAGVWREADLASFG